MPPLVAGIDCSTQSTKVVLVDPERGGIVATARAPHRVTGEGGARETDPEVWWEALRTAVAATGRAADVAAISVAGQQHGLVVLDERGLSLRPATLWNDTRSAPDAERLVAELGGAAAAAQRIGSVPLAAFTATSWLWLRRVEPAVAARVARVRLPHDFMTERLCGNGVTDRGDASGTAWWSPFREAYDDELLALIELDPSALPAVLGPRVRAGEVTAEAAAALGIPAGTPVACGTGDNMAAALGLGIEPGTPVVSLGTSGTAFAVSTTPTADATGVVAGFADATGRYLPLACTLNCTLAIDRIAGWLDLDRDAVEDGGEVVVLPFLDGERTPNRPRSSGTITGLRHATTPGQILRAAYEGAAFSLLDALEQLHGSGSGLDPNAPVVLVGGGSRGRVWQETIRRLSGRAVLVPEHVELVALGAAAQAAGVLGGRAPEEVARGWDTAAGVRLEAVPRDQDALSRIRAVRKRSEALDG
ncbi:MAG: xylulokinase [Gaiellales bacterium]